MVYRIATVSFLNTVPLVAWFGQKGIPKVELLYALPSRLSTLISSGSAEVALLPVVEVFQGRSSGFISNAGIACHGKVDSVKLFSRGDMASLKRVFTDRGSRTSVALLRILFGELHGHCPEFIEFTPRPGRFPDTHEGVLVIGDRCFEYQKSIKSSEPNSIISYDLGELWHELTRLPFVFAAWAGAPGLLQKIGDDCVAELRGLLEKARDFGLSNLDLLAQKEAASGNCGPDGEATNESVAYYFKESLRFSIGEREMAGIMKFRKLCVKHGVVPGEFPVNLL